MGADWPRETGRKVPGTASGRGTVNEVPSTGIGIEEDRPAPEEYGMSSKLGVGADGERGDNGAGGGFWVG